MKSKETLDVEYYLVKNVAKKGTYGCKEVLAKIEKVYNLGGAEIATLRFGYLTTYGESKAAN